MSNTTIILDSGGKYRVQVDRVKGQSGEVVGYGLDIAPLDRGVTMHVVFESVGQISAFIGYITDATLGCASKISGEHE